MPSKQIKIDSDLHQKVKEFVDNTSRYSNYKSFYEDSVRRRLDEERSRDVENLKEQMKELMEDLEE